MNPFLTRRAWLSGTAGGLAVAATVRADTPGSPHHGFRYGLNTSTVRTPDGKPRPITELVEITAKAGYDGIEPWVSELSAYADGGGSLKDLGKRIADAGLKVPNAVGFAEWIVDDPERRKKGLERAKHEMELVAAVGGERIAAPPVGATGRREGEPAIDLLAAAERYAALFDVGKSVGVVPVVEVWGFSKTLSRLGEVLFVATECGRPGACILPDVYHLYKGGSGFDGLRLLNPSAIGVFHVNDYPDIPRETIGDADRVHAGDGIAPVKDVCATLRAIGYTGFLSLELFNRGYWKQDPLEVAKTGLAKMKAAAG